MAEINGIVLGNIGSGKSTFLKSMEGLGLDSMLLSLLPIQSDLHVEFEDPAVLDIVTRKFYPALAAKDRDLLFAAEIDILWARFRQAQGAVRSAGVVLAERSLYEDRFVFTENLYAQGLLAPHQMEAYRCLFDRLIQTLPPPDVIIYLACDPQVAHRRMVLRGRDSEKGLQVDYLQQLHALYEQAVTRDLPPLIPGFGAALLVINVDQDLQRDGLEKFHRHIETRMVRLLQAKGFNHSSPRAAFDQPGVAAPAAVGEVAAV